MDATQEQVSPRSRWYIVHTYSGFEQRVELTINEMMRTGQDKGLIEEVVMPTEKVVEMVKGERKTSTRKFYPGYIMVKMILTDDSWHLIQSIPRVTGFVGGKNRPTPMRGQRGGEHPQHDGEPPGKAPPQVQLRARRRSPGHRRPVQRLQRCCGRSQLRQGKTQGFRLHLRAPDSCGSWILSRWTKGSPKYTR